VVGFTPLPLYLWYPLHRRLGGPQSRCGLYGKEKILDPTGTRSPLPVLMFPNLSQVCFLLPHQQVDFKILGTFKAAFETCCRVVGELPLHKAPHEAPHPLHPISWIVRAQSHGSLYLPVKLRTLGQGLHPIISRNSKP
jgi:hypothetical protein